MSGATHGLSEVLWQSCSWRFNTSHGFFVEGKTDDYRFVRKEKEEGEVERTLRVERRS